MKKYLLIPISNIVSTAFKHSSQAFSLAGIFILLTIAVNAQNNNIFLSGKVVEGKNKTPLEGATVHIKGTTHEVVTDKSGTFKFITAQRVPVTYVVSFVGFQTQEVSATEPSGVQIELNESNSQLNDVVVIGYGTQSK